MVNFTKFVLILFLTIGLHPSCRATPPEIKEIKTKDDKTIRVAHWPCPPSLQRKTILLLQGMGGYAERYQETAEELVDKGYDVWTLDWRGQGGSHRATTVPTLLHLEDFSDYHYDLDALFEHILSEKPIDVIAISMGGHIALRYAHTHPNRFKSLILLAPMIEINSSPFPLWGAKVIAKTACATGLHERFVLFYGPYDSKKCRHRFNPQKHGDRDRFDQGCHLLENNPHLATGGPSFGWVAAALDSCDTLQNKQILQQISVPTLLLSVKGDQDVNEHIHENTCATLSNCRFKQYENAPHSILHGPDAVRNEFWKDFEAFMAALEGYN